MVSFIRLLRLSGLLNEKLTPDQARQILTIHGVNPRDLNDPTALKAARNKLMLKHHPDRGGNPETAKEINAAYDVLITIPPQVPAPDTPKAPETRVLFAILFELPDGSWYYSSKTETARTKLAREATLFPEPDIHRYAGKARDKVLAKISTAKVFIVRQANLKNL